MHKSLFILLFTSILFAQKKIDIPTYPNELTQNAVTIINQEDIKVNVLSQERFITKTTKVITVLDQSGLSSLDLNQYYSKTNKIKYLQVSMYDKQGDLLHVFKQKDFKDYSLSAGMSITDTRILTLEYKPVNFPVTFIFESELESRNTAFLPKWSPINYYNQSIIHSSFSIDSPLDLPIDAKLYNPDFVAINESITPNKVEFSLHNFPALISESNTPSPTNFLPKAIVSLQKIHLEGVNASFTSWEELGNWYYNNLIQGTETLSEQTKQKVDQLVLGVDDPIEKAKILYEYMQGRTRYISIQLGIGGWKPVEASEVDRLGYGDCKGLSNYYRALLKQAGVESYPVVIYGNSSPVDIQSESVCLQGNHMILAIALPSGGYKWVECTDQKAPFGYIAGFTDNRTALVVKPQGSELVKTQNYSYEQNLQQSNSTIELDPSGDAYVTMEISSTQGQFDNRNFTYYYNNSDKQKYYKSRLSTFKIDEFDTLELEIDKDNATFKENLAFKSNKFATKLGNRLMVTLTGWNSVGSNLSSPDKRITPFSIESEWLDEDTLTLIVPQGYTIDKIPTAIFIESEFGTYTATFSFKDNVLEYKRKLFIISGSHSKEKYKLYREFREQINTSDQIKIIINPLS
ncbi:transglutaminase domain-containing protein [Myroides sp. LJL115]